MAKQGMAEAGLIASAHPTAPRRLIGTAMVGLLGMMILLLAKQAAAQSMAASIFLALVGGAGLWFSFRFWQSTAAGLILTKTALQETTGRVVVLIDDVARMNRGTFAAKPATGFALGLKASAKAGWAPGLWWRIGGRVGVGGALSRAELRVMSDRIEELLRER